MEAAANPLPQEDPNFEGEANLPNGGKSLMAERGGDGQVERFGGELTGRLEAPPGAVIVTREIRLMESHTVKQVLPVRILRRTKRPLERKAPKVEKGVCHGDLGGHRNGEQDRKPGCQGCAPSPAIKPEQHGGAGPDLNRGPYPEDREELDDRLPELGASRALTEGEWLSAEVLLLNNAQPQATISVVNPPEPSSQKGYIHAFG